TSRGRQGELEGPAFAHAEGSRPPEEIGSGGRPGSRRSAVGARRLGFPVRPLPALRQRCLPTRLSSFPVGPLPTTRSAGGLGNPEFRRGGSARGDPLPAGVGGRIGVGGGVRVSCRAAAARLDGPGGGARWFPGGSPHLLSDPLLESRQQ